MKIRFFIIQLLVSVLSFSQTKESKVLDFNDYIEVVKTEHPIAKRADIKINEGDAQLLFARGAFDPKLFSDIKQKYFNDTQYYSILNGGVKIPTWFGIELEGSFSQNQGIYLNPENKLPDDGLLVAGISIPVGRGLIIDKRRAELKKAKLYQNVTEAEKRIILNDLIYQAGNAYWKWFKDYNALVVYRNALQVSKQRLEAVKQAVRLGSKPQIDTLEAGIQVQNWQLAVQQSEVVYKNSSALLSVYLWAEGLVPVEISDELRPPLLEEAMVQYNGKDISREYIDSLVSSHPELNRSRFYIQQMKVDKQLKKNQLLPVLNLKYNPITEFVGGESIANFSINNYTWGVNFLFPIFLRKERGSLKLAELKIQEYNLLLKNKQEQLKYKALKALNQWTGTSEQVQLYMKTVTDSETLLKGEERLFDIGESSLFLVNSRESGFIKTKLKLIGLVSKNKISELEILYTLGILGD